MKKSKLFLPKEELLSRSGEVDYFDWDYKFPIEYIQRYRFKKILKLLGPTKYPSLLEAGTGSGVFLPELSKHCDNLFAIDVHHHFDKIEQLCKEYKIGNYNLSSQSIENTNFPGDSFDVIVAVSVLEFVSDIQKAATEIKRIKKKDGIFVTICPMESKFLDFFLSFYTRKPPKQESGDARQKVSKLLEKNFRIVEKGYMLPFVGKFFPVYTHYKLKK